MADPFSITAGIISIAVPALQGLRLLLHDLQSIKDAPETIGNLKDNIWAIELALTSLQAISEQEWKSLGTTIADEVKATIATCTKACEIIRSNLQRWTGRSQDGNGRLSWLDRAMVGFFKQGQIKSKCEQLQSCKIRINSVVSMATLYSSLQHARLTEEVKKMMISMRQGEIETAISTTDNQIVDIQTRRNVDGAQAPKDPESEAAMLRRAPLDHRSLSRLQSDHSVSRRSSLLYMNSCPFSLLHELQGSLSSACIGPDSSSRAMYVPLSSLRELITESKVRDILREEGWVQDIHGESDAWRIVQTSMKLFAILVSRKRGADIFRFLDEGISDTDLPFTMKPARAGSERMTLQTSGGRDIRTTSEWQDSEVRSLAKKQWRMLAPVFKLGKHYDFPVAQNLPFTKLEIKISSAFSLVFQAFIHPAHHALWNFPVNRDRQAVVAVKKLFLRNPSLSQIERDMHIILRRTSGPHRHLISLLFTYTEGGKFHLVFPWADVDLRHYWKRIPLEQIDYRKVLWSLKQMTGLASALSLIHGFQLPDERQPGRDFGRHGDLKAENIVWFPSYPGCTDSDGILQITDLSLASLHNLGSVSDGDWARKLGTKTYMPPDTLRNLCISRTWDIWSLGCLYLEFITWIVLGFDAVIEFAELRGAEDVEMEELSTDHFYTTDLRDVRLSVKAWVARLSEDERCSDMLYDLLCLIMRKMIRIEPNDRIDSPQLHQELLNLLERVSSNGAYLVRASERSPI